jgi:hypothetical protein
MLAAGIAPPPYATPIKDPKGYKADAAGKPAP